MLRKFINPYVLLIGVFFAFPACANGLPDFTGIVKKEAPAVVNISTTQHIHHARAFPVVPPSDPFYEFFKHFTPQMPRDQESQSLGSGFIISADGYIMTNAHVIDHADKITVRLTDKREFAAHVIGADKRTDVALIKINAVNLPTVLIGDPGKLKVGQWVVAIGSPFGFDSSVTAGIVSAKGRALPKENYVPFIQTDVAINPGNSGGPLFNMNGEVVGINSQIYTRSGGSMGLSFAIPIDVAKQVADQLRASGKVTRGHIGVTIQTLTRELADSFGLKQANGALVSSVEKAGPADKAGIEASDVILKFNGRQVINSNDLPRIVASTPPGSEVLVEVWRKGAVKSLKVVVAKMVQEETRVATVSHSAKKANKLLKRLGLMLNELNRKQLSQLKRGLLVEEVTGQAARAAGLRPGDVLMAIGPIQLHSLSQLEAILKEVPTGRNVALLVRRGHYASYVAIKLDDN
ncbi:MAG: DegQ family serine endoprotease [Gallionella sp.]